MTLRFKPLRQSLRPIRSGAIGAIALGSAVLLMGIGANQSAAIAQPRPTPTNTVAPLMAERRIQQVSIADLVSQPDRWQGRVIQTLGRLQPGKTGIGCTKMACGFPETATIGDQRLCNRCFGSAVLQGEGDNLVLAEVRCQGVEILTYRGDEPIDRTINWTGASFDSRTLSLDRPYAIIGTLRPQTTAGASESAAAPAYVFQVQSIEPVENWRCSFCSPRSVHDHPGSAVSQGAWLQPIG